MTERQSAARSPRLVEGSPERVQDSGVRSCGVWWVALAVSVVVGAGLAGCRAAPRVPVTLAPALTVTALPSPTPTGTPTPRAAPPTPTSAPTPSPTATPTTVGSLATMTATPAPSSLATPVPAAMALVRGPYLQSVTAHSIVVAWETNLPGQGEVAYGETEAYGLHATDPAIAARHAVTLTGLAPYTLYHYRVESEGAPLSADATFRSAAGPGQADFTFVVFGDTRTQHQYHRAVVERIQALAPDFALHTGDLVADGREASEWETFFDIERDLLARVPLFTVLGNHEHDSPLYLDLFYLPGNEHWYAFDYGGSRFVCLEVDGITRFSPGSEQYAWLEQALATNTQPWLFVAFHVPPYTSVEDGLEGSVRRALVPLFERYGVDVVFGGHKHNYERNEVNGITYLVTGGGGAPLYALDEQEPSQAAFTVDYNIVRVEVYGDRLKATVISDEGAVLDEFERRSFRH